jgi:DNA-binding MarR family transcriptional regulator
MDGTQEQSTIPRLIGLVRTLRECCQRQETEMCHLLALTGSQFACLLAMPETDACNVQEVAQAMGLSPSRTSRVVDSLVRSGLLDRSAQENNRRKQVLVLTPLGRSKWRSARKLLLECEQKLLSQLTAQPSHELEEAFRMVIAALAKEAPHAKQVLKPSGLASTPE